MRRYMLRRVVEVIPVLVVVAGITFMLMHAAPGGPWDQDPSERRQIPPEILANLQARYHLDRPLAEQFAAYLLGLLRGDLGPSYSSPGDSVREIIGRGLGVSVELGLAAILVALALGIPLGMIAAVRQHSVIDYVSMLLAIVAATIPAFVLSLVLIVMFAVHLQLLPPSGWDTISSRVMPVIVLAAGPTALVARHTRASLLDTMTHDYVLAARAKGLRERTIILRHVLRVALLPIITLLGPLLANLLTGSFVVETIFRIPGVGRLFVNAISDRDYPLIMGTTLLYAVVLAGLNLVVDVVYIVADPRISYT